MTVRGSMTITSSSRYALAAKRYRGGMTALFYAHQLSWIQVVKALASLVDNIRVVINHSQLIYSNYFQ
ncbi:hypothetical protein ACJZL1_01835 [Wolbachia endosymbiont of Rhagoletis indifferens]|uniref:hypothetical protein n=1 Tax=Wolbachia endosymbiont of Rhagoletis indifferens TaxID=3383250 RepID=UPI003AF3B1D2